VGRLLKYAQYAFNSIVALLSGRWNFGYCPICEAKTIFLEIDPWLRDFYRCVRCGSIPRQRAVKIVLEQYFPNWRELQIHESSPGVRWKRRMSRECKNYVASYYFEGIPFGTHVDDAICQNLELQTFGDNQFDVVVTQDVMEHVYNAEAAFSEIARTLRPGGMHIFTTPRYKKQKTAYRAVMKNGKVKFLAEPAYHRNPIDAKGALVTVDWGDDIEEIVCEASKMKTHAMAFKDRSLGLDGEFLEVFISVKA
jgi:SAM-dependent methyltransferase